MARKRQGVAKKAKEKRDRSAVGWESRGPASATPHPDDRHGSLQRVRVHHNPSTQMNCLARFNLLALAALLALSGKIAAQTLSPTADAYVGVGTTYQFQNFGAVGAGEAEIRW